MIKCISSGLLIDYFLEQPIFHIVDNNRHYVSPFRVEDDGSGGKDVTFYCQECDVFLPPVNYSLKYYLDNII